MPIKKSLRIPNGEDSGPCKRISSVMTFLWANGKSFHSVKIHILPWCHDDCLSSSFISQWYHGGYSDIAYCATNAQYSSQANSQHCYQGAFEITPQCHAKHFVAPATWATQDVASQLWNSRSPKSIFVKYYLQNTSPPPPHPYTYLYKPTKLTPAFLMAYKLRLTP